MLNYGRGFGFGGVSEVVKQLIIINVLVFIVAKTLSNVVPELSMFFPLSDSFRPYQVVTHMFMHANFTHIMFNMLSLYFLGPMVEKELGEKKFLIFYLICGFGAALVHFGVDYYEYQRALVGLEASQVNEVIKEGRGLMLSGRNNVDGGLAKLNQVLNIPVVGASGAIYGVTIGFAALFPNVRLSLMFIPYPVKAKYLVVGLIAYDLFLGVGQMSTGIAHFAHLGGGLFGYILILIWKGNRFKDFS